VARHGLVLNIAVRPLVVVRLDVFARGTLDAQVVINAENYSHRYSPTLQGPSWGPHPLLEAALRTIPPRASVDVEVTIRSEAPPGASMGTSAAVQVALLAGLDRLAQQDRTPHQIAELAHSVETDQLGRLSGVQDQLCSALGGVNFIEVIEYPRAVVSSLELSAATLDELDSRLVLVYLGRPHSSSEMHERVMQELEREGPRHPRLEALRRAAATARGALQAADLEAFGRAMNENNAVQAQLHPDLIHREAWRVGEIATAHGAVGWKVNGAGGDGGSITILSGSDSEAKDAMVEAILHENHGFRAIPVAFSRDGVTVLG
jgi:D-glycero-alpha-D-manno-heptose-7-phosphate kinase